MRRTRLDVVFNVKYDQNTQFGSVRVIESGRLNVSWVKALHISDTLVRKEVSQSRTFYQFLDLGSRLTKNNLSYSMFTRRMDKDVASEKSR